MINVKKYKSESKTAQMIIFSVNIFYIFTKHLYDKTLKYIYL